MLLPNNDDEKLLDSLQKEAIKEIKRLLPLLDPQKQDEINTGITNEVLSKDISAPSVQHYLGYCYHTIQQRSQGQQKEEARKKAFSWYKRAANKDYAPAQVDMAWYCLTMPNTMRCTIKLNEYERIGIKLLCEAKVNGHNGNGDYEYIEKIFFPRMLEEPGDDGTRRSNEEKLALKREYDAQLTQILTNKAADKAAADKAAADKAAAKKAAAKKVAADKAAAEKMSSLEIKIDKLMEMCGILPALQAQLQEEQKRNQQLLQLLQQQKNESFRRELKSLFDKIDNNEQKVDAKDDENCKQITNERQKQFYKHFKSLLEVFYETAKQITDEKTQPDQQKLEVGVAAAEKAFSYIAPIPHSALLMNVLGKIILFVDKKYEQGKAQSVDQVISRSEIFMSELAYQVTYKYQRQIAKLTCGARILNLLLCLASLSSNRIFFDQKMHRLRFHHIQVNSLKRHCYFVTIYTIICDIKVKK